MKLHFCEAIEIDNLNKIEKERKQRQQDWIALFEEEKNTLGRFTIDWKEITWLGLIWKGFKQKQYDFSLSPP